MDPDGKTVTNKTNDYIIVRLEDPILFKKKKIDTVVLAPGDKYLGKVDGTRDKDGNYTKISAQDGDNIDYTVEKDNQIKFDNDDSKKQNNANDFKKKLYNLAANLIGKDKKLISGSYPKNTEGGKFLSDKWNNQFRKDLGEDGFNDYEKAYQSEVQKNLRKEMVINTSEDKK